MIYTVTLNPSLDYNIFMNELNLGEINRSLSEELHYGGKGINVSVVLKELGLCSVLYGFTAGFTGNEIERLLKIAGIDSAFIKLCEGNSRINIKFFNGMQETAVNATGPIIGENELECLYNKIECLNNDDILILAGSLPKSLPSDTYEKMLKRIKYKKIRVIVDAEKETLLNTLKHEPFLIKPNTIELGDIFNKEMKNTDEIKHYAKELKKMGARNVIVSRGDEGALMISDTNEVYEAKVKKINPINTVGAGDSLIAGFLAGYLRSRDYGFALALGTAAGTAAALSKTFAKKEHIYDVFEKMVIW